MLAGVVLAAGAMLAAGLAAQEAENELTLPPLIDAEPGDARLEAAPEAREDVLEAVVTGGQTDWRLPDLGTSLRAEREARDPNQRMEVGFVPLYDPEDEDPNEDFLTPEVPVMRGVGMIRLIELRFGRRSGN